MTTIAYHKGMLAADTRVIEENLITPETCRKVHRLPDGSLFAFCGCLEDASLIKQSLIKHMPLPKIEHRDDETACLHIRLNGTVYFTTGKAWVKVEGTRMASIGTGSPSAYAAMRAGLSPDKAVRIAMAQDPNSGGRVHVLRLRQNIRPGNGRVRALRKRKP